jgi:hypothetical protein
MHTRHLQVVAPLGPSAVALAANTQQPAQRVLVDEYARSKGGSFTLQTPATELATYLNRRSMRVALVPDVAEAFAAAATAGRPEMRTTLPNSVAAATKLRSMQSTNSVLMVAPTAFGFNEQAAQDNSFMHAADKPQEHSSLTAKVREGLCGGAAVAGASGMLQELRGAGPSSSSSSNSSRVWEGSDGAVGASGRAVRLQASRPTACAACRTSATRQIARRAQLAGQLY